MTAPFHFDYSAIDQMLLSTGMTKRLLLACALGGVIGLEREYRNKASGLRTNMLICMGSAFFTMLSAVLAGENSPNRGQVASNIVQGIGFLGAGLILHTRSRVMGLTSAATVWVVAAIGMACGAGLYLEAALGTLIVMVALLFVGAMEARAGLKRYPLIYEVRGTDRSKMYLAVLSVLDRAGMRLSVMDSQSIPSLERVVFSITTTNKKHAALLAQLKASAGTDEVVAFSDIEDE